MTSAPCRLSAYGSCGGRGAKKKLVSTLGRPHARARSTSRAGRPAGTGRRRPRPGGSATPPRSPPSTSPLDHAVELDHVLDARHDGGDDLARGAAPPPPTARRPRCSRRRRREAARRAAGRKGCLRSSSSGQPPPGRSARAGGRSAGRGRLMFGPSRQEFPTSGQTSTLEVPIVTAMSEIRPIRPRRLARSKRLSRGHPRKNDVPPRRRDPRAARRAARQLCCPATPATTWRARSGTRMIDRRPAAIVRAAGAADVMQAVRLRAASTGLLLAVRGGGHNIAGKAVCDGGLMLDLSAMSRCASTRRRARRASSPARCSPTSTARRRPSACRRRPASTRPPAWPGSRWAAASAGRAASTG